MTVLQRQFNVTPAVTGTTVHMAAGLGMRMPTVPRSAVPRVPIMVPPARELLATWDFRNITNLVLF